MRTHSRRCFASNEVYKPNTSRSQCLSVLLVVDLMLYSTDVNFIASQALARSQQRPGDQQGDALDDGDEQADAMAALERQARAPQGFVPASSGSQGGNIPQQSKDAVTVNPDVLDVDLDDE